MNTKQWILTIVLFVFGLTFLMIAILGLLNVVSSMMYVGLCSFGLAAISVSLLYKGDEEPHAE